jgi:hypothetical protein
LLLTFIVMSLVNLSRSARAAPNAMPRKQLITLIAATLMAGLTAPVSMAATRLGIPLPRVTLSLLLGCAVVLLGVGVARYSALVEGRVIGRDLAYNAVAVGLVTGLYLAATWLSVRLYRAPAAAFTFVLILAVVTHSLVDVARRALDTVFYRHDQALRANLRRVARVAGEGTTLDDYLAKAIRPLGAAVHMRCCGCLSRRQRDWRPSTAGEQRRARRWRRPICGPTTGCCCRPGALRRRWPRRPRSSRCMPKSGRSARCCSGGP